ncbi:hypothetical protein OkiPb00504_00440 [Escherichia coli]
MVTAPMLNSMNSPPRLLTAIGGETYRGEKPVNIEPGPTEVGPARPTIIWA